MFNLLFKLFGLRYFDADTGGDQGGMGDLLGFADGNTPKVLDEKDVGEMDTAKVEEKVKKEAEAKVEAEEKKVEAKPKEGEKKVEKEKEKEEEPGEISNEDRIAKLMEEIEATATEINVEEEAKPEEKPAEEKVKPAAEVKPEKVVATTPTVLVESDEAYTTFIQDKDGLNAFGDKIKEQSISGAYEEVVQKLLPVIAQAIPKYVEVKLETERFYDDNPDLIPVRKYSAKVFALVDAKNPTKSLKEKFELTAKEVRKKLGITNVQPEGEKEKKKTPKFVAGNSGARIPEQKVETGDNNSEASQIDEMLRVAQN